MPSEDSDAEVTKFDQRFCWTQNVNFTFGFSDNLYVQFKTDRRWRARYFWTGWEIIIYCFILRGFNCTVTCEAFDFSELFARIPLTHQNTVEEEYKEYEDEDEDEDYDYEEEEELEEEEDDYNVYEEKGSE